MRFEFATAGRILFGQGTIDEVPAEAAKLGRRAFVVTGNGRRHLGGLAEGLSKAGIDVTVYTLSGEPTTATAEEASTSARGAEADMVIGIGGGSVIDLGKAVAALLTNAGELMDYLEVIGRAQPLAHRSAPYIAIPTTAGTGAEVTRNAVLGSPEHRVKVSMRSPLMLPALAVVDPLLTLSVPRDVTASTGLDALTQLLEPFICNAPNPLVDGICREGLRRVAKALPVVCRDGNDVLAREDMSMASLFGGLALANARLGAVHGFAGPLGGMFPAPHGALCARLLPFVMEANLKALLSRESISPSLSRLAEASAILTGRPGATAEDGVAWVRSLCTELDVAPLSQFGIRKGDIPQAVEKARRASSMKGNPIDLKDEELAGILAAAIG